VNTEKSTLILSKISIVHKKFSFGNVFSVCGVFGLFTDVTERGNTEAFLLLE